MMVRQFPSQRRATRRVPRALAIVLLGLQAFLWGGGSIAEARSAAESLSRYSHVEDQGTTACPPLHSHLDCVICRTLTGGASPSSSATLFTFIAVEADRGLPEITVPAERGVPGTLGSRGPPVA
jgi:hypothetical protein